MIERFDLTTADGETLEARFDSSNGATAIVVFCHPHPLHGGSMIAPLMIAVTTKLVELGMGVVRFNFRGVGTSTGEHGLGESEQTDIQAAVEWSKKKTSTVGMAGWSFGAATSLRWLAKQTESIPYVGIAPPTQSLPLRLPNGPKRLVLGSRDQLIDRTALIEYAAAQSIDLVLTPGDHFFHGRGKRVGELVAQGFSF